MFAIKVAILPIYIPIRYVPLASDISRPMRETNDPPVFSHSFIRKCCTIGCDKIYWIPTRPSVRAVSDDFFQFDCFHALILLWFGFCLVFSAIKRCDKTYSVNYRLCSCGFFGLEISTRSVCVDNCPVCQCDSYFHYLILLWFGFGLVLSNEEGKRYLELPYPNKSGTHRIFRLVYKLGTQHLSVDYWREPCKYSRSEQRAVDQS